MFSKSRKCRWPGCETIVMAHLWACKEHWERLPHAIRGRLKLYYRPRQEQAGPVDERWLAADAEARAFASAQEAAAQEARTKSTHQ